MAARNPSDYTRWIDKRKIVPGKSILAATLDSAFDDQEFVLDAQQLIVSDCFAEFNKADSTWTEIGNYLIESKDICDETGFSNDEFTHDVSAYAWVSDVGTTGQVRFTSALASSSTTVTISLAGAPLSAAWSSFSTMNIKTNENEDTIKVELRRSAGSGTVYLAGIAIFAQVT